MIYQCVDCEQHYCSNCDDGGEDSCSECSTGPRCNECAADHADTHIDESADEDDACPDDPDGLHHVGCGCER